MQVISLMAQKGGAGKTLLSVHLAVAAEQAGKKTVLIDLDEQKSTGEWWRSREDETPILIEPSINDLPTVIKAAKDEAIDLVIIDTPPHAVSESMKAATVSDLILIPCRPSILDLRAIGKTVDLIKTTNKKAAIVLNSCPPARGLADVSIVREARKGLADYGLLICPISITQRVDFSHALIDGRSVTEFAPQGKASKEIHKLWKWIEETI